MGLRPLSTRLSCQRHWAAASAVITAGIAHRLAGLSFAAMSGVPARACRAWRGIAGVSQRIGSLGAASPPAVLTVSQWPSRTATPTTLASSDLAAASFGVPALAVAAAVAARQRRRSSTWVPRRAVASAALDFRQGMGSAAASGVVGMEVALVPCLNDNYAPIFHDKATGATAVVDTPEVAPILAALEERGWCLTHILNTHHHADHTGGNLELKQRTGCLIVGPKGEASRIPGIDLEVGEGDEIDVGSLQGAVLEVGGHTAGHIAYHFPDQRAAFVGDTLFVLGCGRVFEGTPAQMWESLQKIRSLPDETVCYCAHEYTASNARFAMSVGGVPGLSERASTISEMREEGCPTVPTVLAHEKATNPFLRADTAELRDAMGLPDGSSATEVFTQVRLAKDRF